MTLFVLLALINIGVWAGWLGWTAARFAFHRHWHRRYFHDDCGFHTEWKTEIDPCCRGCGQFPAVVSEAKIMRATFFWGWEEKA